MWRGVNITDKAGRGERVQPPPFFPLFSLCLSQAFPCTLLWSPSSEKPTQPAGCRGTDHQWKPRLTASGTNTRGYIVFVVVGFSRALSCCNLHNLQQFVAKRRRYLIYMLRRYVFLLSFPKVTSFHLRSGPQHALVNTQMESGSGRPCVQERSERPARQLTG